MTNYNEIKKHLIQEYNANIDQINDLTHRINLLASNELGSKATQCLGMALLPWMGTFVSTPHIVGLTGLPFNVVQSISYISALSIGTITGLNLPLSKKRRKEFLATEKVRTEEDIIKLETRCQMEKSHLIYMNQAIKRAYESFCAKETLQSTIENSAAIEDQNYNTIPTSLHDKITNLTSLLEQKEHELRLVTSKKILRDLFWRTKDSYYTYFDTMMYGFTALGLVTVSYCLPGVSLSYTNALNWDAALAGGIIAGVTGCAVASGTIFYKRHTKRKVYKELNEELGSFSLSSKQKDDEENLEIILVDLVCEIQTIKMELEVAKQKLNTLTASINQKEAKMNQEKDQSLTSDTPISLSSQGSLFQAESEPKILKKIYPTTQQTN